MHYLNLLTEFCNQNYIRFFLGGGKKDKNLKHSNKKVEYTNESVYN